MFPHRTAGPDCLSPWFHEAQLAPLLAHGSRRNRGSCLCSADSIIGHDRWLSREGSDSGRVSIHPVSRLVGICAPVRFPFGLNVDHDFPFTRSLADPWSWAGLLCAVLCIAAAWRYRKQYPLAAFGCLAYFLLLAPTSSFIPIADPLSGVSPCSALSLIVIDLVRHAQLETKMPLLLAGIVALLAVFTYQRSALWGSEIASHCGQCAWAAPTRFGRSSN